MGIRHHIKVADLAFYVGLFITGLAMLFLSLIFPSLLKVIIITLGGILIGQITMIKSTYEHAKEESKKHRQDAFASFLLGNKITIVLAGVEPDASFLGLVMTLAARFGLDATEIKNELIQYIDSFRRANPSHPLSDEVKGLIIGIEENIKAQLRYRRPEISPFYMIGRNVFLFLYLLQHYDTLSDNDKKSVSYPINQIIIAISEAKKYKKNLTAINEIEKKVLQPIIKLKENIPDDTTYLLEVSLEVTNGVAEVEKWYYDSLAS